MRHLAQASDVQLHIRESILIIVVGFRLVLRTPSDAPIGASVNDDRCFEKRIAHPGDEIRYPKRKRTNSRWPQVGIIYPANRPDPDGPGGLGAEESGTERTGPTQ
jgi:hypothetical protein